jgi:dipeptidyl aminopeptidase/acylaminoacyl peptidase
MTCMKKLLLVGCGLAGSLVLAFAEVPGNLVVDGIPVLPAALVDDAARYLEFRSATFQSWHPTRREMLIATRFGDVTQLHQVRQPGGARQQLTFLSEPVGAGAYRPKTGEFIVFSQDAGGGEFYQLFRRDADGRIILLTDGKSRNMGARWSHRGDWLAYTSTRRNGRDNDIHLVNPTDPKTDHLLFQVSSGGWRILDWSGDDSRLLVSEYVSINESYLHIVDIKSATSEAITPRNGSKVSWTNGRFAPDGQSLFVTSDLDSEFQRLGRFDLSTRRFTPFTTSPRWDIDAFELSPDGRTLATVANRDGASVLQLLDARSARERRIPDLPVGVITGLEWHPDGKELGFTLASARAAADAYSLEVKSGRLTRWTESETGGLDPASFVEPELIHLKSFDDLSFSAFVYRPDPGKFPGPRPVIVSIHGGPESQSRPTFQARNNYYLNELGVALVVPNVRGSDGHGKTFLTLDNGFKREDAVRDIGAVLDWIGKDGRLDRGRVAVMGGSYGGYMTLASMVHYSARLRCGVDVVGISSFVTFLKSTQEYRRDLRRAEYGDERDEKMLEHLERISPLTNVKKITKPLLVVQGRNDPRVPVTEAEQMVKALRESGVPVWYLMARDEGHGFNKKRNVDYQFLSTILFFKEHLLK